MVPHENGEGGRECAKGWIKDYATDRALTRTSLEIPDGSRDSKEDTHVRERNSGFMRAADFCSAITKSECRGVLCLENGTDQRQDF